MLNFTSGISIKCQLQAMTSLKLTLGSLNQVLKSFWALKLIHKKKVVLGSKNLTFYILLPVIMYMAKNICKKKLTRKK